MASQNLVSGNNTIQRGAYANVRKYPSSLEPSPAIKAFLKSWEKLKCYPYDDRDKNAKRIREWNPHATIGYGHLITKKEWPEYNRLITVEEAEELFKRDLYSKAIIPVRNHIKVQLKQHEFDALLSLLYNIGLGNFKGSNTESFINNNPSNYRAIEKEWKEFRMSGGKVLPGLERRRKADWNIYQYGIYKGN